jgi:hypothetical protein
LANALPATTDNNLRHDHAQENAVQVLLSRATQGRSRRRHHDSKTFAAGLPSSAEGLGRHFELVIMT